MGDLRELNNAELNARVEKSFGVVIPEELKLLIDDLGSIIDDIESRGSVCQALCGDYAVCLANWWRNRMQNAYVQHLRSETNQSLHVWNRRIELLQELAEASVDWLEKKPGSTKRLKAAIKSE